jgi:hypothetical protein
MVGVPTTFKASLILEIDKSFFNTYKDKPIKLTY